jgi:hypothetical protein
MKYFLAFLFFTLIACFIYAQNVSESLCTSCYGNGSCFRCAGTGFLYHLNRQCGCDGGRCSFCGGTGRMKTLIFGTSQEQLYKIMQDSEFMLKLKDNQELLASFIKIAFLTPEQQRILRETLESMDDF